MRFLVTSLLLFGFWLLLSGKLDLWHLSWGIGSVIVVSLLSNTLLFKAPLRVEEKAREVGNFLIYLWWLLKEIWKANLHVAYLAFHPRMKDLIDPRVIRFKTRLKKELALVCFANSITLTPGTITLLIKEGHFYVHAIDKPSREGLPGEMEIRVGKVFGER